MTAFANAFLFTQFNLDSGALTQLGSVAHRFPEPGEYCGVVLNSDQTAGTFILKVSDDIAATQTNIDLASIAGPKTQTGCCSPGLEVFSVHSTGYAVFHVSTGAGGYAVTVNKIGQPHAFDSRALKPGDLFTAILLRPGTYAATALEAAGRLSISVSYPAKARRVPYRPPAPARVEYSVGQFHPAHVKLKPAQGLIFETKQDARIQITLEKPDDGA